MKLLVTGGAGFIGSNLVHYLLGPASAETGKPIDLVVNLDKLTYAGNLENLAPIAKDARHTDEVFGTLRPEDPAFSETTPYAPNSAYSASKAGSDFLARAYHHTYGLDVVTTNCSNNYGPYQFPEKLVPLMIRKISRGEALPVYGDGQQVRDWLYVEDHCRGLLLALLKGKSGETYCLGGRSEKPNLEVVHTLISLVTAKLPADQRRAAADLITYVKDRPGHDRRYAIDCSKSERELGWSPHENFASGMARTVDWYDTHESWVSRIEAGTYRQERLGTSAA